MAALAARQTVLEDETAEYLRRTARSRAYHERALTVFPDGSTRAATFYQPYPVTIERSDRIELVDLDGNEYLDFLLNYTTFIVGHRHPSVMAAAQRALDAGSTVAAPMPGQVELAEILIERVPSVELVRFVNSGSEATMLATRLARAFTGRDLVIKAIGGYHGSFSDLDAAITPSSFPPGVPTGTAVRAVPFNDIAAIRRTLETCRGECAAVILEPVLGSGIVVGEDSFLGEVQKLCADVGALFILDEVITFRLGRAGYQGLKDLHPDLTTFGKIIGGGFPVGAVGGSANVMELLSVEATNGISHSGTFNGNRVTAAAGRATLELLDAAAYETLDDLGALLADGLSEAISDTRVAGQVTHVGSLVNVHFTSEHVRDGTALAQGDTLAARTFHLGLLNRGISIAPRGMFVLSTVTSRGDVERAVKAAHEVLRDLGGLGPNGR